jgi:phosphoribosylformylglycinamidine synthase subunit PurS
MAPATLVGAGRTAGLANVIKEFGVAQVIVDVMLKPEILDAQGQAIQRALGRLGFDGIRSVRQGKRFEVELEGEPDEAARARVEEMAEKLLANTVIEDFEVRVAS